MADKDNVCNDYKRGVCTRETCKFEHPGNIPQVKKRLPVCRDFQSTRGCSKLPDCTRMHLTIEEEDHHTKTGELPPHGGVFGPDLQPIPEAFCKFFLNNACNKGDKCKFRHVTRREMALEIQLQEAMEIPPGPGPMRGPGGMRGPVGMRGPGRMRGPGGMYGGPLDMYYGPEEVYGPEDMGGLGNMYGKRRRIDDVGLAEDPDLVADLQKQNLELKRQLKDLRDMNDLLCEQNSRFKKQLQAKGGSPKKQTQQAKLDIYAQY